MPKLTKRIVDSLQPADKDQVVWDSKMPGFGIRVMPSGVKSYVIQYRNAHGRSRRMTVGRHSVLTVDEARKEAKQFLAAVDKGRDPVAARRAERDAPEFKELCKRYVEEHVEVKNRPSTIKEFKRLVEKRIEPGLGHLKVSAVTRTDIAKLHRSMNKTPRQANIVLSVLSKMFSLSEVWGMRPDGSNPCLRIERYPEVTRERFLSDEELKKLGKALDKSDRSEPFDDGKCLKVGPEVANALRLLALTGCRASEIVSLKWAYVDFTNNVLWLPETKTGARGHTIGAYAIALLSGLDREEGAEWVFPSERTGTHITVNAASQAWRRIREKAGLEGIRLHDLRHTVGTYAGQTGANAFLVRDKLGHRQISTTARYVNQDSDPLKALSDTVESRIQAALDGESVDNVVAIIGNK